MNRRELLALIAAGGAGCASGNDGTPNSASPTEKPTASADSGSGSPSPTPDAAQELTDSPTPTPDPDRGQDEYGIGGQFPADNGLIITVNEVGITDRIEFEQSEDSVVGGGEYVQHPESGNAFVLAKIFVENASESPATTPGRDAWALLSGANQFDVVGSSFRNQESLTYPIEAPIYTSAEIHPDIEHSGYVAFEVPADVETVTVALADWRILQEDETAYWQTNVDRSTFPFITLDGIEAPDSVPLGQDIEYTFRVVNDGGAAGTLPVEYRACVPQCSFTNDGQTMTINVGPGEEIERTVSVAPDALGDATLELSRPDERTFTTTIEPGQASFGDSWKSPSGVAISVSEPVLTNRFVYRAYDERETKRADSGEQFAFVQVQLSNETDESVIAPATDEFTLFVDETGHQRNQLSSFSDVSFVEPISGPELLTGFSDIAASNTMSGWIQYIVEDDASLDDLRVGYATENSVGQVAATWD